MPIRDAQTSGNDITSGVKTALGIDTLETTVQNLDTDDIPQGSTNLYRPATVSQADAEAGTSTTVASWTPERVKQAVTARVSANRVISSTVLASTAASISIDLSSYTHDELQIIARLRSTHSGGADYANLRVNSDTTASNYGRHHFFINDSTTGVLTTASYALGEIPVSTNTAGRFALLAMTLSGLLSGANTIAQFTIAGPGQTISKTFRQGSTEWLNTAAVTNITILPETGSFATGSRLVALAPRS